MARYYVLYCALLAFLMISCQGEPQEEQHESKLENESNLQHGSEEIKQKGRLVEWAINNNRMDTVLADFWQSDSAFFMANGRTIDGYDQIMETFQRDRPGLKIKITEDKVIMLSPESGIHLAWFDQTVTDTLNQVTSYKGVWSAVYRKIEDEWKVVVVHESLYSLD